MGESPRALASQRPSTIVIAMPQRPKDFRIDSVTVRPDPGAHPVPTGPGMAAPSVFVADVHLAVPDLYVKVGIKVAGGGLPVVHAITVRATASTPLTSTSLRKVLLDPIVRAALAEASQLVEDRSDVAPGAFHVPGEPEYQLWAVTPAGAADRVHQIARLYREAVTAGSKSPGQDAADAVHISRGQAARYIRKARELGLLAPLEEILKAAAPGEPVPVSTEKPEHGPSIFRDPSGPRPWEERAGNGEDQDD